MKSQYEDIIRIVCGEDWSDSESQTQDDRDGAFGIAIILAYLQGVPARLKDLADAIDVPPYLLDMAFKRLQANGLFSPRSFILNDPILLGKQGDDHQRLVAWCYVAGMASGYTGMGFTREEYAAKYGKDSRNEA